MTFASVDAPDRIVYLGNFPDLHAIRAAVEEIWSQAVEMDSEQWSGLGIRKPDLPRTAPFHLDMSQGADVTSVTLLVLALGTGISISKTVVLDVWKQIVLPKLKRRFGADFKEQSGSHK